MKELKIYLQPLNNKNKQDLRKIIITNKEALQLNNSNDVVAFYNSKTKFPINCDFYKITHYVIEEKTTQKQKQLENLHSQLKKEKILKLYLYQNSGSGRFSHYIENKLAKNFVDLVAKTNNYFVEYGNDAPRGGKNGDYVIIKLS